MINRIFNLVFLLCFLTTQAMAIGAPKDKFKAVKNFEGQYFTFQSAAGVDLGTLSRQINLGPVDKLLAGKPVSASNSSSQELMAVLDALVIRVMDTLDMKIYSFKGSVKVVPSHQDLEDIFYNLYGIRNLPDTGYSFFVSELNTIYISQEHFKMEILAHEIAHAIISAYFVVQPPMKIQEVLAGYMEYQLRKLNKSK